MNEIRWAVSQSAIAVMILTALFAVVLPLGLGLWFRRRTGGRWRFFLLGAVIFPLFALGLEGSGALVEQLTEEAVSALNGFPQPDFLIWLARELASRRK